jgi:short-subunit dehydrogenase
MMNDLSDRTALVTGASSGIGREIAELFASKGCNLVITARREELLQRLKKNLEERYSINVDMITEDLSDINSAERIYNYCISNDLSVDILVNNAGYGLLNTFDKISLKEHVDFVNVLSTSVVTLTHSFLSGMLDREFGRIINISSISGLTSPANASGGMYSGVKSMIIKFSEGIHKEYSHKNVFCCAVCPGFTHTEFHENMKEFKNSIPSFMWMTSKEVAKEAYEASMQGKELYVNGFFNRFLLFVMRILPKWLNNLYVKSLMRKRH